MNFTDDGYCFVCGHKNPIGLKLDFSFDGKTIKTEFTPKKEHQGYQDIVHGGIISILLDEAMVKLAIAMGIPVVTAQMEIRLRKALNVGQKIIVTAKILKDTKKILEAHAEAATEDNVVIAEAKGKLVRV
ncbi:MAG: PaaI family thioesterase [Nitrospirae bacterium]|nr:PaaI family thioesterase [Nitrospirota bacterium]